MMKKYIKILTLTPFTWCTCTRENKTDGMKVYSLHISLTKSVMVCACVVYKTSFADLRNVTKTLI